MVPDEIVGIYALGLTTETITVTITTQAICTFCTIKGGSRRPQRVLTMMMMMMMMKAAVKKNGGDR